MEGEPGVLDESWPAGHEALEDTLSPRREKFVLVDRQVRCDVIMAHQVQVPQFLLGADAAGGSFSLSSHNSRIAV